MKRLFAIICLTISYFISVAQGDTLTPLGFNPKLYNTVKRPDLNTHKYLIDRGQFVVSTDTLGLPFVDDFTHNNLRSYKWVENHVTDTFYNAIGPCLVPEGVTTERGRFMENQAWYYTFDTTNQQIDSTPIAPIQFTLFGTATSQCFTQTHQIQNYWPEYYYYTFDSTTGRPRDSVLVDDAAHPGDSLDYAPVVYISSLEPGKLWFDNYAYVNNTYPILPPTLGVATLDGLDQFGMPYNNSSVSTYGNADYLTSKPINLGGLTAGDSVYLSFYYEGGGLGDYPDVNDSLLVDFRDIGGIWRTVWSIPGYGTQNLPPDTFKQVLIQVPDMPLYASYYFPAFQFRIHNMAALYGNLDHWHIDYVKLAKQRSVTDTAIQDISFVYPFPTILKNYTQLPADQITLPDDLADTINLLVHNLDPNANSNPPATNFVKSADESYPATSPVLTSTLETFNAGDYSTISVFPKAEYSIPASPNWPVDSLSLNSSVVLQTNDSRTVNDTLVQPQMFSTVAAYDDGSAESAYGLTGTQIKKFGYEFNLAHPDTLVGFQVMFAQLEENVSNLIFNFTLWDSLVLNNYQYVDTPIIELDNQRPLYIDSINGFATYVLDSPLVLSNKIYMGWVQNGDEARNLQIGYDMNSKLGYNHMYVYFNGYWHKSTLSTQGSPMIRLIFDSNYWGSSSPNSISETTPANDQLNVYPNPSSSYINISNTNGSVLDVDLYNSLGQQVEHKTGVRNSMDISLLQNGVYIIIARNPATGKVYHSKLLKTSN